MRVGGLLLGLLTAAVFINTADRGLFATAAPLLRDELHLSNTALGLLFSAFFWSYVPALLASGWLIDRFGVRRTLAGGLALWALATAGTAFGSGFAGICALRLALGAGESVTFPCVAALLARTLPPERLGAANGIIMASLGLGPAVGTYAGTLVMHHVGWRGAFLAFGLASLLWLAPWQLTMRPAAAEAAPEERPGGTVGYAALLRQPALWTICFAMFCANYPYYLVLSWLPSYMVKARGLSMTDMGEIVGAVYLLYAAATAIAGSVSDRLVKAGAANSIVRKGGMAAGGTMMTAGLLAAAYGTVPVAIGGMFLVAVALGIGSANVFTIGQTLAGPEAAGKWIAIQNGFGNLAGIVAPALTGWVIDRSGDFVPAFLIAGVIAMAGVAGWTVALPRLAPVFRPRPA